MNSESFYGQKKQKARKIYAGKKKTKFSWNRQGIIFQRGIVRRFLDIKGAFYNGNESDNDNESNDGNNEQQQLPEGFANSCYKIVSPILLRKLIDTFAISKHCNETPLLVEDVSHGFRN